MTQKMGQLGVLKNSFCFLLLLLACNSNQSPSLDKNTSDVLGITARQDPLFLKIYEDLERGSNPIFVCHRILGHREKCY